MTWLTRCAARETSVGTSVACPVYRRSVPPSNCNSTPVVLLHAVLHGQRTVMRPPILRPRMQRKRFAGAWPEPHKLPIQPRIGAVLTVGVGRPGSRCRRRRHRATNKEEAESRLLRCSRAH